MPDKVVCPRCGSDTVAHEDYTGPTRITVYTCVECGFADY